jgi:hypothetical protein
VPVTRSSPPDRPSPKLAVRELLLLAVLPLQILDVRRRV